MRLFVLLLLFWAASLATYGQQTRATSSQDLELIDLKGPLMALEQELKPLYYKVLNGDSTREKIALNDVILTRMKRILSRLDSYDYGFDSLVTISRIFPEDNSFRIFTWYIRDEMGFHRYYGLVQRKCYDRGGNLTVTVTELKDEIDYSEDAEAASLSPDRWFGALYYKPKNTQYGVLTYEGRYLSVDGAGRERKTKAKYYILLGWNGHDQGSDYKIIDVIGFSSMYADAKISFGAPIFYFSRIPISRAVFKYSDNSPFSLNYNYVAGFAKSKKVPMVTFDHIAKPNKTNPHVNWEFGPDGSTDGIFFLNRVNQNRKGFFVFVKNVLIWSPGIEQYDPSQLRDIQKSERRRLIEMGIKMKAKPTTPPANPE
jgi:hypothetical protein